MRGTRTGAGPRSAATSSRVCGRRASTAQPGRLDTPAPPGISVFDAETDDGPAPRRRARPSGAGPVLWIGSGGLAQALAGDAPGRRRGRRCPLPVLGLFGSDQAVTAGQLAACGAALARCRTAARPARARSPRRLRSNGRALASLDLPPDLTRAEAAERIGARACTAWPEDLPRPGTLLVAGGETLARAVPSRSARAV